MGSYVRLTRVEDISVVSSCKSWDSMRTYRIDATVMMVQKLDVASLRCKADDTVGIVGNHDHNTPRRFFM